VLYPPLPPPTPTEVDREPRRNPLSLSVFLMARIRTLKPEFWDDEKLGRLSPIDRLVFLGIISQADDAGRLLDNVRRIDGLLFPYSDESSRGSIETLARLGRVCRYEGPGGEKLLQVVHWDRHQRVVNPSKYTLPPPSPEDLAKCGVTEAYLDSSESLNRVALDPSSPTYDPRPCSSDPGPATNDHGSEKPMSRSQANSTAEVAQVIERYRVFHPRAKPGDKEKRLIRARLKDGYSADDLCACIDGYHKSPHHLGDNDRGVKYLSLGLFLRDSDHVQKGVEFADGTALVDAPNLAPASRRAIEAGQRFLERRRRADG